MQPFAPDWLRLRLQNFVHCNPSIARQGQWPLALHDIPAAEVRKIVTFFREHWSISEAFQGQLLPFSVVAKKSYPSMLSTLFHGQIMDEGHHLGRRLVEEYVVT